jgi:hypothetical protein
MTILINHKKYPGIDLKATKVKVKTIFFTRGDSCFSFTYTTVPREVIAVHLSQISKKQFNCSVIPTFFWPFSLKHNNQCSTGYPIHAFHGFPHLLQANTKIIS